MDKYDLYCQVTRDRYLSQELLNREFSTKIGTVISFGGAMVGAGAVIQAFAGNIVSFVAFVAVVIAFLVAVGHSVPILLTRNWRAGPRVADAAEMLEEHDHDNYTKEIANLYGQSVEANRSLLDGKAEASDVAVLSLAAEALFLGIVGVASYFPV